MTKISGIRSVDFMVIASGEGVVNHNGSMSVVNPAAETVVDNHMFPKLRGLDPMRKIFNQTTGKAHPFNLSDPDLANVAMVVSSNCIRSHIFKNASFGVSHVTRETVGAALASLHGLMRGYLITDGNANFSRKSPLFLTDFECAAPGLRYNQACKAGERTSTSIYSYFGTDKNLQYIGYGSIAIEDLQFIPLENSLGRSAFSEVVSEEVGNLLASAVTQYLRDVSGAPDAEATFVNNAVRRGTFIKKGDAGLLLNDAALSVLVNETLELIRTLYIRQGKGYLRVDELMVDYNEGQAFRIMRDESAAIPVKSMAYAQYYDVVPLSEQAFTAKMQDLLEAFKKAADNKRARKGQVKATATPAPTTVNDPATATNSMATTGTGN